MYYQVQFVDSPPCDNPYVLCNDVSFQKLNIKPLQTNLSSLVVISGLLKTWTNSQTLLHKFVQFVFHHHSSLFSTQSFQLYLSLFNCCSFWLWSSYSVFFWRWFCAANNCVVCTISCSGVLSCWVLFEPSRYVTNCESCLSTRTTRRYIPSSLSLSLTPIFFQLFFFFVFKLIFYFEWWFERWFSLCAYARPRECRIDCFLSWWWYRTPKSKQQVSNAP